MIDAPESAAQRLPTPLLRPGLRFALAHPAHFIALGAGSGLARQAPGTVGTLWAWAAFAVLQPFLGDLGWALLIAAGTLAGWWACTVTARHMGIADSGHIVWDEVVAFWLVLWLVTPTGLWEQLAAFVLSACSTPSRSGPWPGPTGPSRASGREADSASCWTISRPRCARCWSSRSGDSDAPPRRFERSHQRQPGVPDC